MKDTMHKGAKGKVVAALDAALGFSHEDVMVLDATAKDLAALRKSDMKVLRERTAAAAYNSLFGVFDKGTGGGPLVGSAVKACAKARNGGKNMKARTVTGKFLSLIPDTEVLAALDAHRTKRFAELDAEAAARRDGGTIGKMEVKPQDAALVETWLKTKKADFQKDFERAQEWINTVWPRIPAAINAIRALSGGSVKTIDGATLPVDLAFERVLMNRSESAAQLAKVVVRGI